MAMVMTLLLDTHVWLWMLSAPERLNAVTQALLADRENQLWLSVASVWEVAIKQARSACARCLRVSRLDLSAMDGRR
jgi:PIN domain nuclease of toxin-antitoxin system